MRRIPAWVLVLIGAVLTGAALIWEGTQYDAQGQSVLDPPMIQLLIAFIGAVVTILGLLLKRSSSTEHELKPNSGKSLADKVDRIEAAVNTIATTQAAQVAKTDQLDHRLSKHIVQSELIVRALTKEKP